MSRLTPEQLENMTEEEFRAHLLAKHKNCKGRGLDCGPCERCYRPPGMTVKAWRKIWPCHHQCEKHHKWS